ncbi:MAG: hypothetical protein E5X49_18330 [Mesorhizobium sp.]|nr:MAG: hypothetical protein EOQ89_31505 [Mesorhizobium sp.]RWK23380.1 MAG: hypothetical protein EOR43_14455 [Mesorhizobium sp.]RWK27299.1 MAG: hypothetical protein EOR44_27890 [Mesorhizobium sp.]RWM19424.1 MAG: hypothetical protein EOR74_32065 [Mesorhizobium sp.]TIQ41632.1 MAG: hypothetical protein E5X49_18330 [Mesorhizobium sp.]
MGSRCIPFCMRANLWNATDNLIQRLSGDLALEDIPPLCSECRRLASKGDCPCPSSLLLVQHMRAAVHQRLDAIDHLSEQGAIRLKAITDYLATVVRIASERGDAAPWIDLASRFSALFGPDEAAH